MDFFSEKELKQMGFMHMGSNNKIHRSVCFEDINKISLGNNVEIKPFSVIRGHVVIYDEVSIGEYSYISAMNNTIILKKNVILSQNVVIHTMELKEENQLIIEEGIKIECQCIITKSMNEKKGTIIPLLSVI